MTKLLKTTSAAIAFCVMSFGAAWAVDQYLDVTYAFRTELELVEYRLNQKILADQEGFLQRRIWALEDRCGPRASQCSQHERAQWRELTRQLQQIRQQIAALNRRAS